MTRLFTRVQIHFEITKYRVRNSGAFNFNRSRVIINDATVFCSNAPEITSDEVMASLGKLSSLRWDTLAYIKSGATRGTNFGSLTKLCFEQVEKMNEIVASVFGDDPSILEHGFYSRLFRNRSHKYVHFAKLFRINDHKKFFFTTRMEVESQKILLGNKWRHLGLPETDKPSIEEVFGVWNHV